MRSRPHGSGPAPGGVDGHVRGARILYPLTVVYRICGIEPPAAKAIDTAAIPDPYRALLVHETDMTHTLERHIGDRVLLRPLSTAVRRGLYFRRVLLVHGSSGRPVEMGAIRIDLDAFPAHVRTQILEGATPLGRILREAGLNYRIRPQHFLEITPNSDIMGVFRMREPRTLYGRQTTVMLDGAKIGQVVEILPLV
ncbi:MAG TPA: hypothetical protein VNK41_06155 [Vicinamibacterales bacterium]|nr:hypothetical protein [Vicinamibacterales bacterium]